MSFKFAYYVNRQSKVLAGARVTLREPMPETERVYASEMKMQDGTMASEAIGAEAYVLAKHLLPDRDGTDMDDTPYGVQMRIIKEGQHYLKDIWINGRYGPGNETYTLWLRDNRGGAEVVQLTKDEIVPMNPPYVSKYFPPTCVGFKMQDRDKQDTFVTGILIPVQHEDGSSSAYENTTGMCYVNIGTMVKSLLEKTDMFTSFKRMPPSSVAEVLSHLHTVDDQSQSVVLRVPWYRLVPQKLSYVSWGKVVRMYGIPASDSDSALNGKLAVMNKVYTKEEDNNLYAEFMPLDKGDSLGPVRMLEAHGAPAEVMPTMEELYKHITMVPHNVHSLTRMVLVSAMNAEKIDLRSEGGYMKCDKEKLKLQMLQLGKYAPPFWYGLQKHCITMFCEKKVCVKDPDGNIVDRITICDDPNTVCLTVRAVRGLAEFCWRCERNRRREEEQTDRDWKENINQPQTHHRVYPQSHKKIAEAKKNKMKKKKKNSRKKGRNGKKHRR